MSDIIIYGVLIILIASLYLISRQPFKIEQDCTCGKFDKCVSKVTIRKGYKSLSISREPSEMIKCGKVQEQLKFNPLTNKR